MSDRREYDKEWKWSKSKVHTFVYPGIHTDMFSGGYNMGEVPNLLIVAEWVYTACQ